jgi:hypothetical protein
VLTALSSTGCQTTDAPCLCTKSNFISSVEGCVTKTCTIPDQTSTVLYINNQCAGMQAHALDTLRSSHSFLTAYPSTTNSTSTPSVSSQNLTTPLNNTSSKSSGLSQGAKTGVGVGVSFGVLAILILAFVFRHFQVHFTPRPKLSFETEDPESANVIPKDEEEAIDHEISEHEFYNQDIVELPDSSPILPPPPTRILSELDGNDSRTELPTLEKPGELPAGFEKLN